MFDEEEKELSMCGSLSDFGEDSFGELLFLFSKKRLRKLFLLDDNLEENNNEELNMYIRFELNKKVIRIYKERVDDGEGKIKSVMIYIGFKM